MWPWLPDFKKCHVCWIIREEINLLTKLANHQAKSAHHFSLIQTFAVIWSKRGRKRPLHIQKLEVVEGWWRETFKITFFILYICSLIRGKLFFVILFILVGAQTDRQTDYSPILLISKKFLLYSLIELLYDNTIETHQHFLYHPAKSNQPNI